ncbi:acyl-CoA synthetase [Vagococcus sp. BWB3-3]|uniref:Acyl-CoA synthetase n=1 Tax=Vagococcus allomyrinae TaxID=2794353 RepID=A0A940PBS7_9ENTE|nr:AMP-binding protein [Vagococcus allomyrinae]MBP1040566.1 acyl-CoA synthetase [Vagococcus allomyrinae]
MEFPNNPYEELNLYNNFSQAAKKYPTVAIHFDQELIGFPELGLKTTYQAAEKSIVAQASRLSSLGIQTGDKVVIYKSPMFDTYMLAVAVSYLGAVPIMISYHLPVPTMTIMCQRLENPWLIYDEVTAGRAPAITSIQASHLIELEQLRELPAAEVTQSFLPLAEISYMTHTSGTTGVPKLIAHSAQSMGWRTKWQRNVFDLMPEKKLVAFHISPVHSRFNIGISSLMSKGFPLLWIGNGQVEAVAQTLSQFKPYALETHPNNFVQWSRLAKEQPALFASFNYFHSTFDAINKGTMKIFLEASGAEKPVFMQVYGQSECGPMIMRFHTKASIVELNARNMGVGMPELTEVRIVDPLGAEVPANTSGNIQMLSKGRALTYYQEDQRFTENTYGLWWDSGDFGYQDDAGDLYLLDRQVDLISDVDSTLLIEDLLLDQLEFLNEVVIVRGKNDVAQPIISVDAGSDMDWERWWQAIADFPLLNEPLVWAFEEIPRTATMKVQRLKIEEGLKDTPS